jgi:hypothetical protein
MATKATPVVPAPSPTDRFEFLNPLDGQTYSLPPFDAEKFSDEVAMHKDFIPEISLTDALLAEDPTVGMDSLNEPMRALNVLMKRAIVKTIRNHVDEDDPAWGAIRGLIDGFEFDVLGKIFSDWRVASGDVEDEPVGED